MSNEGTRVSTPTIGSHGNHIITDAVQHTGTWSHVLILSNTVFLSLTDASQTLSGTLASASFPAGAIITGAFTIITLTSGAVMAYNLK